MEKQKKGVNKKNYRVFIYWSNGFKYKFKGELFSPIIVTSSYKEQPFPIVLSEKRRILNSSPFFEFNTSHVDLDYLYESERDDKETEEIEGLDMFNSLRNVSRIEDIELDVDYDRISCHSCHITFVENDLDIVNEDWICQECENDR